MQYIHKKRYTLAGKAVSTISFNGSTANYFRIVNGSACELYAGVVQLPTTKMYDFRIPANSAKMYCEQRQYKSIQIYNNSTDDAEILLFAFSAPFEASALAIADFMESDGEKDTLNVEIGGFTEPLPSGTNKIGNVGIDGALPGGTNEIGKISINSTQFEELIDALANSGGGSTGGGASGEVSVSNFPADYAKEANQKDYETVLADILENLEKQKKKYNNFFEGTATSSGVVYDADNGYRFIEVAFCSNDGETDLVFTTVDTDGSEQSMTVKAGEVLDHIACRCVSVKITGTVSYRLAMIESEA